MAFVPRKTVFPASVGEVTLGVGENAVTLGGQRVLPLCAFDGALPHAPCVGAEVTDLGVPADGLPALQAFYAGCGSIADMAKRDEVMQGVRFLCLRFAGADPNGENRSAEECAGIARQVADAVSLPLVIMGCKNAEKDAQIFAAVSEALAGRNVLLLGAREENYQSVCACAAAHGHRVGAESSVDINLAKQLNTLAAQCGTGVSVMHPGTAAAGYGLDYVVSTLERVRDAALRQSDELLQMPIAVPVCEDAWSVRETALTERELPAWGSREERGIQMEITTAVTMLAAGADAVIVRHPETAKTVSALLDALLTEGGGNAWQ